MRLIGNKVKLAVLISVLAAMLSACPGLNDWTYDALPNGYEIWRVNSQDITFGRREGNELKCVIPRYIIAFCNNDRYIGLQRVAMDSIPYDEIVNIEELDISDPEYYLVDAQHGAVYGPFTKAAYLSKIKELDVGEMTDWTSTGTGKVLRESGTPQEDDHE